MSEQIHPNIGQFNSPVLSTRKSLSAQAYHIIERQIVTLELQPGALINERYLIDAIAMGRTPVREAIQRLAWEGLMDIRPRSGIAITPLDPRDYSKVLDAREGVEHMLWRDAARNSGRVEQEKLQKVAGVLTQAAHDKDMILFLDADKAFDETLGLASLNIFATRLAAPLQTHCRRFWYYLCRKQHIQDLSIDYTSMVDTLINRDETAAIHSAAARMTYLRSLTS